MNIEPQRYIQDSTLGSQRWTETFQQVVPIPYTARLEMLWEIQSGLMISWYSLNNKDQQQQRSTVYSPKLSTYEEMKLVK